MAYFGETEESLVAKGQDYVAGRGSYESRTGAPNDHIIARGQTGRGQPVTMVIGLPAQLAANTYGSL